MCFPALQREARLHQYALGTKRSPQSKLQLTYEQLQRPNLHV